MLRNRGLAIEEATAALAALDELGAIRESAAAGPRVRAEGFAEGVRLWDVRWRE